MVLQSFLYLLVPLNRTELTRVNYYEFLKSSTTPCRKKSPAPVNGLITTGGIDIVVSQLNVHIQLFVPCAFTMCLSSSKIHCICFCSISSTCCSSSTSYKTIVFITQVTQTSVNLGHVYTYAFTQVNVQISFLLQLAFTQDSENASVNEYFRKRYSKWKLLKTTTL